MLAEGEFHEVSRGVHLAPVGDPLRGHGMRNPSHGWRARTRWQFEPGRRTVAGERVAGSGPPRQSHRWSCRRPVPGGAQEPGANDRVAPHPIT